MVDISLPLLVNFDFSVVRDSLFQDTIVSGARNTLMISALAQLLGIGMGVVAAVARNLRIPIASQVASLYIWFFRGTPLLVQLIFWFSAMPQLAPNDFSLWIFTVRHDWFLLSPFYAALIGLSINEGAYMAEIVRSGIESIEKGQMDAAKALGMTNLQAMRHVILPQAARVTIPPTGNEFIAMLKNSSLASAIAYPELLYAGQRVYTRNYKVLELLAVISVWYLVLTTFFSVIQAEIEARLRPDEQQGGWRAIMQRVFSPPANWLGHRD